MNENNINRLTAERVMGWTLDYMHDDLRPKFPMEVWRDSKWNWLMESYLWNPADDLNKAWKVAQARTDRDVLAKAVRKDAVSPEELREALSRAGGK